MSRTTYDSDQALMDRLARLERAAFNKDIMDGPGVPDPHAPYPGEMREVPREWLEKGHTLKDIRPFQPLGQVGPRKASPGAVTLLDEQCDTISTLMDAVNELEKTLAPLLPEVDSATGTPSNGESESASNTPMLRTIASNTRRIFAAVEALARIRSELRL